MTFLRPLWPRNQKQKQKKCILLFNVLFLIIQDIFTLAVPECSASNKLSTSVRCYASPSRLEIAE